MKDCLKNKLYIITKKEVTMKPGMLQSLHQNMVKKRMQTLVQDNLLEASRMDEITKGRKNFYRFQASTRYWNYYYYYEQVLLPNS